MDEERSIKSKNPLSKSQYIDVEGSCTTTESLETGMLDDMEEFKEMVNQLVQDAFDVQFTQQFEAHLSDRVQVVIDLALEAYELKKTRESKKQEYKLVKKNVKSNK